MLTILEEVDNDIVEVALKKLRVEESVATVLLATDLLNSVEDTKARLELLLDIILGEATGGLLSIELLELAMTVVLETLVRVLFSTVELAMLKVVDEGVEVN